jgi:phosphatidylglycerol:prolipoprotein diacylglycerol transferase
MSSPAVITISIAPELDLGPVSISWHGLFIALGILVAFAFSTRFGRERGLDENRLFTLVTVVVLAGIVGARALFLLEHGDLLRPAEWFGTTGFSFYGALVAGGGAAVAYALRTRIGLVYADAMAAGFGLGMAIGRIGDILAGEHFGQPSDLPWAIQYSNPDSMVPSTEVAYHSGALYESLLGLLIFAVIWPRRDRFRHPGSLLASVVGLYSLGRFVIFFWRVDSETVVAGLDGAQLISLGLVAASAVALLIIQRRPLLPQPPEAGTQSAKQRTSSTS